MGFSAAPGVYSPWSVTSPSGRFYVVAGVSYPSDLPARLAEDLLAAQPGDLIELLACHGEWGFGARLPRNGETVDCCVFADRMAEGAFQLAWVRGLKMGVDERGGLRRSELDVRCAEYGFIARDARSAGDRFHSKRRNQRLARLQALWPLRQESRDSVAWRGVEESLQQTASERLAVLLRQRQQKPVIEHGRQQAQGESKGEAVPLLAARVLQELATQAGPAPASEPRTAWPPAQEESNPRPPAYSSPAQEDARPRPPANSSPSATSGVDRRCYDRSTLLAARSAVARTQSQTEAAERMRPLRVMARKDIPDPLTSADELSGATSADDAMSSDGYSRRRGGSRSSGRGWLANAKAPKCKFGRGALDADWRAASPQPKLAKPLGGSLLLESVQELDRLAEEIAGDAGDGAGGDDGLAPGEDDGLRSRSFGAAGMSGTIGADGPGSFVSKDSLVGSFAGGVGDAGGDARGSAASAAAAAAESARGRAFEALLQARRSGELQRIVSEMDVSQATKLKETAERMRRGLLEAKRSGELERIRGEMAQELVARVVATRNKMRLGLIRAHRAGELLELRGELDEMADVVPTLPEDHRPLSSTQNWLPGGRRKRWAEMMTSSDSDLDPQSARSSGLGRSQKRAGSQDSHSDSVSEGESGSAIPARVLRFSRGGLAKTAALPGGSAAPSAGAAAASCPLATPSHLQPQAATAQAFVGRRAGVAPSLSTASERGDAVGSSAGEQAAVTAVPQAAPCGGASDGDGTSGGRPAASVSDAAASTAAASQGSDPGVVVEPPARDAGSAAGAQQRDDGTAAAARSPTAVAEAAEAAGSPTAVCGRLLSWPWTHGTAIEGEPLHTPGSSFQENEAADAGSDRSDSKRSRVPIKRRFTRSLLNAKRSGELHALVKDCARARDEVVTSSASDLQDLSDRFAAATQRGPLQQGELQRMAGDLASEVERKAENFQRLKERALQSLLRMKRAGELEDLARRVASEAAGRGEGEEEEEQGDKGKAPARERVRSRLLELKRSGELERLAQEMADTQAKLEDKATQLREIAAKMRRGLRGAKRSGHLENIAAELAQEFNDKAKALRGRVTRSLLRAHRAGELRELRDQFDELADDVPMPPVLPAVAASGGSPVAAAAAAAAAASPRRHWSEMTSDSSDADARRQMGPWMGQAHAASGTGRTPSKAKALRGRVSKSLIRAHRAGELRELRDQLDELAVGVRMPPPPAPAVTPAHAAASAALPGAAAAIAKAAAPPGRRWFETARDFSGADPSRHSTAASGTDSPSRRNAKWQR